MYLLFICKSVISRGKERRPQCNGLTIVLLFSAGGYSDVVRASYLHDDPYAMDSSELDDTEEKSPPPGYNECMSSCTIFPCPNFRGLSMIL